MDEFLEEEEEEEELELGFTNESECGRMICSDTILEKVERVWLRMNCIHQVICTELQANYLYTFLSAN